MSAIAKAYEVLNLLKFNRTGLSTIELAEKLSLSPRQAARYINTLGIYFPVYQDEESKKHRLLRGGM